MREIKYQAWDKIEKRMFNVDVINFKEKIIEVWGEARQVGSAFHIKSYCMEAERKSNYEVIGMGIRKYSFSRVELREYTGLKDKNGEEGYCNDISGDEDGDKYVIEWGKGCFYLKGIGNNILGVPTDDLLIIALRNQEIIGNIYENPELLEAK